MKKTLEDLEVTDLAGRPVLVRADLNVPLENGAIADDGRLQASLPTLEHLSAAGARVILLSHLGRPDGVDPAFSLKAVSDRLDELLEARVAFCPEPSGEAAEKAAGELGDGEILLLENTRFLSGDTENDPELARSWASLADLFVNDAFGTAHRAHASTSGLAEAVRARGGEAVAGFLLAREMRFLGAALEDPERPFVAVLGGAKISGKIDVIHALLPRVDRLLIGGAMANTFFRALGLEIGSSLVEEDRVETARTTLAEAGDKLILPVDCVVAHDIDPTAPTRVVERTAVKEDDKIADIGPATREMYGKEIRAARTVLWNGPMGVFELDPFSHGTRALVQACAESADAGATVVLGGGDSAAAAREAGMDHRFTHVSTGGGASLELLAGEELPGVSSLSERG